MRKRSREEKDELMLNTPMTKLLMTMAVPTIIAHLVTAFYNITDTYFVSSLGTYATAAVGVNGSLDRIITLVGTLIGSGAASYIARLLGAKEKKHADNVLSTSLTIGFAVGFLILIFGILFIKKVVYLLGATDECIDYSMQYARYILFAGPFMICSLVMNQTLRGEGSATLSMIGIAFGGILNCALDPLFIFTLDLGVAGASIATAISKLVSFCILLYPYVMKKSTVIFSLKNFKYRFSDAVEVTKIGSTSFFRALFNTVANIVMNHIAGSFSTVALAAISVANRVMEFPFHIVLGFDQGYQPVTGYNWGAKRFDRVREGLKKGLVISLIGSITMSIIMFFLAVPIIKLFNPEANAEMLKIGRLCIRFQCGIMPIHACVSLLNMFFAGIGCARWALVLNTSRQGYCFIPALLVLPRLFGVYGLAGSQAAGDFLSAFVAIPLLFIAFKMIRREEAKYLPQTE